MANIELDSNRFLVALIGIDNGLMAKSPEETQNKFLWASRFVIAIMCLTLISVFYAFELMFQRWYVEIFLALFISLMFGTIYVLLIQTFSKQQLGEKNKRFVLNSSNLTRGIFVIFIGFLISKPIEILVLSKALEADISNYKNELKREFAKKVGQLTQKDVTILEQEYSRAKAIGAIGELKNIQDKIEILEAKEEFILTNTAIQIDLSEFFLRRIQLVATKYPIAKLICLIIIVLFSAPVVIIYMISAKSEYYKIKQERDEKLVKAHYDLFCSRYITLFERKFQLSRSFHEIHIDPPFRTILIPPIQFALDDEYFKSLAE